VRPIFTFGSDIPARRLAWRGCRCAAGVTRLGGDFACRAAGSRACWHCRCCGSRCPWAGAVRVAGGRCSVRRCLWRRGGEHGEGRAAAAPGSRREPGGCAAGVFLLAVVPGGDDPLVAGDDQHRGEQHEGCRAEITVTGQLSRVSELSFLSFNRPRRPSSATQLCSHSPSAQRHLRRAAACEPNGDVGRASA
jgi:hypothetical protein